MVAEKLQSSVLLCLNFQNYVGRIQFDLCEYRMVSVHVEEGNQCVRDDQVQFLRSVQKSFQVPARQDQEADEDDADQDHQICAARLVHWLHKPPFCRAHRVLQNRSRTLRAILKLHLLTKNNPKCLRIQHICRTSRWGQCNCRQSSPSAVQSSECSFEHTCHSSPSCNSLQ